MKFAIVLHFLTLVVHTHSQKITEWLNGYYKSFDQSDLFRDSQCSFQIYLEELDSEHSLKFPAQRNGSFAKFCTANAHCYYDSAGVFYSSDCGRCAHDLEVDVANRVMRANVGGEFMESEESFIYNVIRDVFGKIVFPFSSLLMLHGSVVTNGERTFFFAGDKGMGKSTVALQMMQHGYKILSDDSPLVTSKNHACVLSSLDELSVTENTLSLFPTLSAAVSRQREISGKFFVSRNRLDKKMLATGPCEITDFVFLDRKPGANLSITPVSKTDATGDLIKEFMALFPVSLDPTDANRFRAVNSFVFHTLSQLLRNADAYRLEYFNDHLTQIPNLLQDR